MKKRTGFLALLTGVLFTAATAQSTLRVGIAYDIGGKNDKSFNQAAWTGAQKAAKEFNIQVKEYEPTDPGQLGQGIRSFAQNGFDFILGVGFSNQPSITATAKDFPKAKFAVVDDLPKGSNTTGLLFRENEGSFLVGYIAGKTSSTGVVGFIGGMDIPLIHKFEAGYRAGVLAANPKAKVIAQYVGTTPEAWNNPAKAKEIAASMKAKGADIFFSAAGGSGNGVINYVKDTKCQKAASLPKNVKFSKTNPTASIPKPKDYTAKCSAKDRPLFFIGVDSNQNYLGDTDKNPKTLNYGLTSMVKRVDVAVYTIIKDIVKGERWNFGSREFALNNDGVGFALDEYNEALVTPLLRTQLDMMKRLIVKGSIQVPKE